MHRRSIFTLLTVTLIGMGLLSIQFVVAQSATPPATPALEFAAAIERTQHKLNQDPYSTRSAHAQQQTRAFLAGLVGAAWRLSHHARHSSVPRFTRGDEFVGQPGLYNPDNVYQYALLDDASAYRIHGTRGNHAQLTFQFIDSYPMLDLSQDRLVIDADAEGIQPGETFELFIGGPQRTVRWWPYPSGARAVLVRQTFNDWQDETPSDLHIERIGPPMELPTAPGRLFLAASYLDRITALWIDRYLAGLQRLPINQLPPPQASTRDDGGLSGQQSILARFRLGPDDALLITARASTARYQGIQLGNYWFTTPNPVQHSSSLNLSQAVVDADGHVRKRYADPTFRWNCC